MRGARSPIPTHLAPSSCGWSWPTGIKMGDLILVLKLSVTARRRGPAGAFLQEMRRWLPGTGILRCWASEWACQEGDRTVGTSSSTEMRDHRALALRCPEKVPCLGCLGRCKCARSAESTPSAATHACSNATSIRIQLQQNIQKLFALGIKHWFCQRHQSV